MKNLTGLKIQRARLLGLTVDLLDVNQLNAVVSGAIVANARGAFIGNHNTNSIYYYHKDFNFRQLYDNKAIAIHIDGSSLCLAGSLLGLPFSSSHRVCYLDWLKPFFDMCSKKGYRVLYLGGKPGVAERAKDALIKEFPSLELKTLHGYFNLSGAENASVVNEINLYKPNILIVGMGMPRQERWIEENIEQVECNVILNAGAFFDYIAGEIPTPPRWLGPLGMEWLYRSICEPRRLIPRYVKVNTFFAFQLLKDLLSRDSSKINRKIDVKDVEFIEILKKNKILAKFNKGITKGARKREVQ